MIVYVLFIIFGIVSGALWYRYGERFNQKSLKPQCWEILHYHNKEKFPLYIVHLKSILAGLALIIAGISKFQHRDYVIIFIGSAIIGLHIYQWINEEDMIRKNSAYNK